MKNTRKNYTRGKAQEQLFALEWVDLFTLFNIPNAAFKQMHDQAYAIFVQVARAFAAMPQKVFYEAGNLQNAVKAAFEFATC